MKEEAAQPQCAAAQRAEWVEAIWNRTVHLAPKTLNRSTVTTTVQTAVFLYIAIFPVEVSGLR